MVSSIDKKNTQLRGRFKISNSVDMQKHKAKIPLDFLLAYVDMYQGVEFCTGATKIVALNKCAAAGRYGMVPAAGTGTVTIPTYYYGMVRPYQINHSFNTKIMYHQQHQQHQQQHEEAVLIEPTTNIQFPRVSNNGRICVGCG